MSSALRSAFSRSNRLFSRSAARSSRYAELNRPKKRSRYACSGTTAPASSLPQLDRDPGPCAKIPPGSDAGAVSVAAPPRLVSFAAAASAAASAAAPSRSALRPSAASTRAIALAIARSSSVAAD